MGCSNGVKCVGELCLSECFCVDTGSVRVDTVWLHVGSGLVQVWFRFGSGLVQVGSGSGRDAKNYQIAREVLQKQLLVQVWFRFGSGLVQFGSG